MFFRLISRFFVLAALGAILCAGYLYFQPSTEEPGLVVEGPERILKDLVPGRDYEVEFRVHNRSNRTVRVVGAEYT